MFQDEKTEQNTMGSQSSNEHKEPRLQKYTNTLNNFHRPALDQLHSQICLSTCNPKTIHPLHNAGRITHSNVRTPTKY